MTSFDDFNHLQRNIETLLSNGQIGFFKLQPADIQTKPNKIMEVTRGFKNYHFFINIPYAGKKLVWELIFNPEDFSELPDFDFNDNFFLPEPDIDYIEENVPSWNRWDLSDPSSVTKILNEFLDVYRQSQRERLFQQNRFCDIRAQYEELLRVMKLSEDKVEILIENKNETDVSSNDYVYINLFIALPIDFSELPEYIQKEGEELLNPGEDFAYLNIQFKKLETSQSKVALTLSPRAEQFLGKLKLPKFKKDSTLSGYAVAVQNAINDQIKTIIKQHHARNMFILAVVDAFSSNIVEYDAAGFHRVTFIYEGCEDYDCLVTINLGDKFPQENPTIQLESLYCRVGRTCKNSIKFPYDHVGTTEDTMDALREKLQEEVKIFQNHKH